MREESDRAVVREGRGRDTGREKVKTGMGGLGRIGKDELINVFGN